MEFVQRKEYRLWQDFHEMMLIIRQRNFFFQVYTLGMHELCSCLRFYFNQFFLYLDTVFYLIISWDILRHTCMYFFCV